MEEDAKNYTNGLRVSEKDSVLLCHCVTSGRAEIRTTSSAALRYEGRLFGKTSGFLRVIEFQKRGELTHIYLIQTLFGVFLEKIHQCLFSSAKRAASSESSNSRSVVS